jgi:epoxyqueuosine reductase
LVLTSSDVKARARELGFDLCGVASADPRPELRFLSHWLGRGFHGEMAYLARNADRRLDPRAVLPSARSIVVLGAIYNTGTKASVENVEPHAALLSRYAWGDDYHDVLGVRLEQLESWMRARADATFEARSYVDTGPVVERVAAHAAGLGWIGKNTCLINPELGSWLFLCEILCSLPLVPDEPDVDRCGTCRLCIEACPTQALVDDRVLDATRCLSYLTIELKGSIPEEFRDGIGRHVYGCDICQEVCPWNADALAAVSSEASWRPRPEFAGADLLRLWRMTDAELRRAIKGTPLTRARVKRLRRNLAVAIGNCCDPEAVTVFDESVDAPSVDDPLVQEHVRWARAKLAAMRDASFPRSPRSPR